MLDDFSTELKRLGGGVVLTLAPAQAPRAHSGAAEKDKDGPNEVENPGSTSHSHRDVVDRNFMAFNVDW